MFNTFISFQILIDFTLTGEKTAVANDEENERMGSYFFNNY